MKIKEIITEVKTTTPTKPRNFVAKNAHKTTSGAGPHKDRKKAAKQGDVKHKKAELGESGEDSRVRHLSNKIKANRIISKSPLYPNDKKYDPLNPRRAYPDSEHASLVALSAKANKLKKSSANESQLNEIAYDTLIHPRYGKIEWRNEGGAHMICKVEPNGSLKIFKLGTHAQIAEKWKKIKDALAQATLPHSRTQSPQTSRAVPESASAGATSSASIGTVVSPHLAIGSDRTNRSYSGSPGKSGTKAPKAPKIVQPKTAQGTAKNALDLNTNIFGGGTVRRNDK